MITVKCKRTRKIIIGFLVPYLSVIAMTMLIAILGYFEAFKMLEQDIKEANLSIINQGKDIMDQKLGILKSAAIQMASNDKIIRISSIEESQDSFPYLDFREAYEELATFRLTLDKDFIYDYYLYLENSNYIVTPDSIYKPELFYSNVLRSANMGLEDWKNNILKNKFKGDYLQDVVIRQKNQSKTSVIIYLNSVPLNYNINKSNGTLAILLNKKGITDLFSHVDISQGGWLYIQDDSGQVVLSMSDNQDNIKYLNLDENKNSEGFIKEKINNRNMVVTYTTSKINGWKYVLVLPDNIVMDKSNSFKRFILLIFILSLFIGTVVAVYMAYNNSKPVSNILSQITESIGEDKLDGKSNVFSTINNTLSTLIRNNKSLEEKIVQQKPILLNAFTDRLLKGEFGGIREIEANMYYIGIDIKDDRYLVLMMRMYDRKDVSEINKEIIYELNAVKVLLIDEFKSYLGRDILYREINSQTMAIVLSLHSDSNYKDKINSMIEEISDKFEKTYRMKILFGVGSVRENLQDVWISYQESLETLSYVQLHKGNIKWHDDIPKEIQLYYYPMDFEQRIISYVKAGDLEQIKNIFSVIREENFDNRRLSRNLSILLFNEIKGTTVKLLQHIPKNEELFEQVINMEFEESPEDNYDVIINIYKRMCEIVGENKNDRNSTVINKIKKYIEDNYMNFDIGLHTVASEFHFSEGYLSYFFKEQTGQNFTDFVESIRIREACMLLKDTQLNVNEIALKIGYNNVQSFRRAFKKVEGVSPSTLRR